jgi:hypothetical protein
MTSRFSLQATSWGPDHLDVFFHGPVAEPSPKPLTGVACASPGRP